MIRSFGSGSLRSEGKHRPKHGIGRNPALRIASFFLFQYPSAIGKISAGRKCLSIAPFLDALLFVERCRHHGVAIARVPQDVVACLRNSFRRGAAPSGGVADHAQPVLSTEDLIGDEAHRWMLTSPICIKKLPDSVSSSRASSIVSRDGVEVAVDAPPVAVGEGAAGRGVVGVLRVEVHAVGRVEVDHLHRTT